MAKEARRAGDVKFYPRIYGMALLISLVTVAGLVAVFSVANREHQRGLREWQDRLNLVAESRLSDVHQWLDRHFGELGAIADNPALQLYVGELETQESGEKNKRRTGEDPAQKDYLRNMLALSAQRLGFEPPARKDSMVPANVEPRAGISGIALLGKNGEVLVATQGMPPLEGVLGENVAQAPKGVPSLIDFQQTATGVIQLGFVVPVFAVQGEREASAQIGTVVGIKAIDSEFYGLLKNPGAEESTLEVVLVRPDQENILFLSPLKDDTAPLTKRLSADPAQLDAAFAVAQPGTFGVRNDYRSREVLVTGRAVPNTPWTLVAKINRSEALAESDAWRASLITIVLLSLLAVVLTIVAVWRHASSRKAYEMSVRATRLAAQSSAQEKLLRLVTDNQPESVLILDHQARYRFANRHACEDAEIPHGDIIGKNVESVLGPERARALLEANEIALDSGKNYSQVKRSHHEGRERVVLSEHIPLMHIPVDSLPVPTPGVLVVEQDITTVMKERERRIETMGHLVETLITMVDRRDPFSANHSLSVARVAREVAMEMALDPLTVEATEIAGKLMNIGKIVVPSELLTKATALNDKERQSIRESLTASADLLANVTFDGPVVETLRQAQEYWDGTGPQKRKGEDILVSARIIAVANSFIGMVSPRSYRKPITIDAGIKILLEEMDSKFDRRVVVALINYLDNHGGREVVEQLNATAEKKALA